MAVTFNDILSSICSQVSHISETEFQQIFALGDSKEAKLAYDILLSCGFEVKFYNEADTAKLYISRPPFDGSKLTAKLETAQALAANFKTIKQSLDALNKNSATGVADYAVTFVNSGGDHKQIAISLIPANSQQPATAAKPTASASAAPRPMAAKPVAPKRTVKADEAAEMLAGPQISREYNFASKANRGPQDQRTMKNFMSRFFVQHIGSNGAIILAMIFAGLVIISLMIASKSFLCPDFAVEAKKQNHSVFCHKPEEVEEKNNTALP